MGESGAENVTDTEKRLWSLEDIAAQLKRRGLLVDKEPGLRFTYL